MGGRRRGKGGAEAGGESMCGQLATAISTEGDRFQLVIECRERLINNSRAAFHRLANRVRFRRRRGGELANQTPSCLVERIKPMTATLFACLPNHIVSISLCSNCSGRRPRVRRLASRMALRCRSTCRRSWPRMPTQQPLPPSSRSMS